MHYVDVHANEFQYANGLSEWQHKIIRASVVRDARGRVNQVALDRAKERLRQEVRAILEGRRKPGRFARDRAARAAGVGQTMPSGSDGHVAVGEIVLDQDVAESPIQSLPSNVLEKNRVVGKQFAESAADLRLPSDDDDIYAELEDEGDEL